MSPRLVDLSFLFVDSFPDCKLTCGSGGLSDVVVGVQIDPVLWPGHGDARAVSLGRVFTLSVLEVIEFEGE